MFRIPQKTILKRLYICVPIFGACLAILLVSLSNPDGFNIIWRYFAWANQALSVFTLWALAVWMYRSRRAYPLILVPALFVQFYCENWPTKFSTPVNILIRTGLVIVGGIIIYIGDVIYDGSVRSRLENIKHSL